jgi:hypothetical protein
MSTIGNDLLNQVLQLPREEQQTIVHTLLLQLEGQHDRDAAVSAAWEEEVERRVQSIADGSMKTVSGPEAMAALRKKHT